MSLHKEYLPDSVKIKYKLTYLLMDWIFTESFIKFV